MEGMEDGERGEEQDVSHVTGHVSSHASHMTGVCRHRMLMV